MQTDRTLEILAESRLVAIVRLDDLSQAEDLVLAMLAGGVRAIEFTMTNSTAPQVVQDLLTRLPQFTTGESTIGIGSVRTPAEAELAIASGAQFIVSPIAQQAIVDRALQAGIVAMPGAYTPTEIAQAHQWGAQIVKVFPAKTLGPGFIKDVLAPMPYLKLMPTGGVDLGNLLSYLEAGAVAVGVGSQILDPQAVRSKSWSAIEAAANNYSQVAKRN
jgi:2-dehydro-3-deoxyphosphogluconate aldolase / (4S)-4-hydroxy-2-oxoglutarate aldolase